VTTVEIIKEIKRLPREQQTQVIAFARRAAEDRPASPEELGELARRMVEVQDPAEADRLQAEIVHRFYGKESHA